MFKCTKCGQCCKNVNLSIIYNYLDRGDGCCRYLDLKNNLCTIYEQRPLICQVDACYERYFKSIYTLEEYYEMNYKVCKQLQNKSILEE